MKVSGHFDHFNINVTNLERSLTFYEQALGLKEHHRKEASDGSFTLVYLTDESTSFLLELTYLKNHTQPYVLLVIMMQFVNGIKKTDGYALRIKKWDFIL